MIREFSLCLITASLLFASCGEGDSGCNGKQAIDSSFRYPIEDFEGFCEKLEKVKITKDKLICKFQGPFTSISSGDTTVFTFVLWQYREVLDTCWGNIEYVESAGKVMDHGIACQ